MANAQNIVANITKDRHLVPGQIDMALADAFDLQDAVVDGLAKLRGGFAGFKIAWNAPPLMKKFGMPHPGMGRVFADQIYANDSEVALADHANLMMEPEIVARLSHDIAPGDDISPEALVGKVDGLTVGFEVLDRLQSDPSEQACGILAYNVFNAGAVVGDNWVAPIGFDTKSMETIVRCDDEVITQGTGIAPQPPLVALSFLAGHFTGRGQTMKAGQLVLCGSHMPLFPIAEPCGISVSMSSIGEASFTVV